MRPRPLHDAVNGAFVDTQIGHPTEMLHFAFGGGLPALNELDPKVAIGGIERHIRDKTKPMVNFGVVIFTIIIGHTPSSLGLSNLLEQKSMIAFFDP